MIGRLACARLAPRHRCLPVPNVMFLSPPLLAGLRSNLSVSGSSNASGSRFAAVMEHITFRSEEHTSELQSLMRISYAVFCLKKKNNRSKTSPHVTQQQTSNP